MLPSFFRGDGKDCRLNAGVMDAVVDKDNRELTSVKQLGAASANR